MSYIEGIGDELLLIFIVLVIIGILSLMWLSTSVRYPRVSVIFVHGQTERFQNTINRIRQAGIRIINLNRNLGNNTEVPATSETTNSSIDNNRTNSTDNVNTEDKTDVNNSTPDTCPSTSCEELVPDSAAPSAVEKEKEQVDKKDEGQISSKNNTDNTQQGTGSVNVVENIITDTDNQSNTEITPESVPSTTAEDHVTSIPSTSSHENEDVIRNREVPSQDGHIRIRLKYLDDRQKTVQARPQQTIGEFKRNHFATELAENLMVRLIHNGQELRPDSKSLEAYNIQDSSVIHCLMSQTNAQNSTNRNQANQEEDDLNIGTYIFPLFGVILGLIWYSRISYGRYFNAMSTLSLVGITFMYVIALLATFRTRDANQPPLADIHDHED